VEAAAGAIGSCRSSYLVLVLYILSSLALCFIALT
jgi:hypothetical protein